MSANNFVIEHIFIGVERGFQKQIQERANESSIAVQYLWEPLEKQFKFCG